MKDRVGEISVNTYGTPMKIIEYNGNKNVLVEFQDKYRFRKRTAMKEFNNGGFATLMTKQSLGSVTMVSIILIIKPIKNGDNATMYGIIC